MAKQNTLSVLAYLFGIVGGVVFYLVSEKKDRFLRFHAVQSVLFNICAGIVWAILFVLTFSLSFSSGFAFAAPTFAIVLGIYALILAIIWISLMVNAYHNKKFKLPIIGNLAEDLSK